MLGAALLGLYIAFGVWCYIKLPRCPACGGKFWTRRAPERPRSDLFDCYACAFRVGSRAVFRARRRT
jgi:hypothetical protein